MAIYYIHHPSGNVVIRTDNPYIVLWHQNKGWLTTTAFDEVLHDHHEWRPAVEASQLPRAPSILQRVCTVLISPLRSILALYAGSSVEATPLGSSTSNPTSTSASASEGDSGLLDKNFGPIHWMTALERSWYCEHRHRIPLTGWITCSGSDGSFEYRLESGKWELSGDAPPTYALASAHLEKEAVR